MFLFYQQNNREGLDSSEVDAIGELPSKARSFSRTIEEHRNLTDSSESILLFRSPEDVESPDSAIQITDSEWDIIFGIKSVIFSSVHNTSDITPAQLEDKCFSISSRLQKVCVGDVFYMQNDISIPSKVIISIHNPDDDNSFTRVTLWFSGNDFVSDYTDTDIYVIPPIEPISEFWRGHDNVMVALSEWTLEAFIAEQNAITDSYPNTSVHSYILHYHADTCLRALETNWRFIVYGADPSNEQKLNAIIKYIKKHSDRDIEDWADCIFPDLYIRNEIMVMPLWDNVAIEDENYRPSVFSSFVRLGDIIEETETHHGQYPLDHIKNNSVAVRIAHRFITLVTVASPNNDDEYKGLDTMYSDFIPAPSGSVDYARMSNRTIVWEKFISRLALAADTGDNTLSAGSLMEETINGKQWMSTVFEGMRYLILKRDQS